MKAHDEEVFGFLEHLPGENHDAVGSIPHLFATTWSGREHVCGEDLGSSRASRGRVIEGWSGIEKTVWGRVEEVRLVTSPSRDSSN